MKFPNELLKLIKTYARDMELFEQSPDPEIDLSHDWEFPVSIHKFVTEQLYELMVSNLQNVDLESYITCFLTFPLDVYYRYMQAHSIWRERCALWNINAKVCECSGCELLQLCCMDSNPLQLHRTMLALLPNSDPPLLL